MLWLDQLLTHVRQGKNAFIVTGSIGDGFPSGRAEAPDVLVPWHEVALAALRKARPGSLGWNYDFALGFCFGSEEEEKDFLKLAVGDKKSEKAAQTEAVSAAEKALAKMRAGKEPADALPAAFGKAVEAMLRSFVLSANQPPVRPCIGLIHDADAAWNGNSPDDAKIRAFLLLKRFAENDALRKAGHILVVAVPSVQSLPETFCRQDSPFTVVHIGRPSSDERTAFLAAVCEATPTEEGTQEPEAPIAPPRTTRPFEKQHREVWAAAMKEAGHEDIELLTADVWSKVAVGDAIIYRMIGKDSQVGDVVKIVLERRDDDLLLSSGKDLMVPQTHTDGQPILFGWDAANGLKQRRNETSSYKPVSEAFSKVIVDKDSVMVVGRVPADIVEKGLAKLDAYNDVHFPQGIVQAETPAETPALPPFVPFKQPSCGVETAGRITCGMAYRDILGLLRVAQSEHRAATDEDILRERHVILARSYGHLLDVIQPAYGFEGIAGLHGVKACLLKARDDIRRGLYALVPQGVLLMGPPGTGKTAICEAFAHECGFLFVKLKNIRNMYVGKSESNQEELFAALRALAPIVVMRDEIDQEDTGRDAPQGDTGVSNRMRQKWMEFLASSDIRGRIFVISCTNRPDLLDAALKRSGRTDERLVLAMPDDETRSVLFDVMFKRMRKGVPNLVANWDVEDVRTHVVAASDGWSGADIEVVVRHAVDYGTLTDEGLVVCHNALKRAVGDFIPSDAKEQVARMELSAIAARSRDIYLPNNWESIVARHAVTLNGNFGDLSDDIVSVIERVRAREAAADAAEAAGAPAAKAIVSG